jgi:1,4-alpha-glucan branching enzyme
MDWGRKSRFANVRQFYQDLIALRLNRYGTTAGLSGGNINVFHKDQPVLGFHRWNRGGPGDDVVVLMNWSAKPVRNYYFGLPRAGRWHTRLNSDWSGYGSDYSNTYAGDVDARPEGRDGLGFTGSMDIGPYSVVILSQ